MLYVVVVRVVSMTTDDTKQTFNKKNKIKNNLTRTLIRKEPLKFIYQFLHKAMYTDFKSCYNIQTEGDRRVLKHAAFMYTKIRSSKNK